MRERSPGGRFNSFNATTRLVLAVFAGLCRASPAAADCIYLNGGSPTTATIALPASLSASRHAAVGSVLYDSSWVTAGPISILCHAATTQTYSYANPMTPVAGRAQVYATGVSGIGIKVSWLSGMSRLPSMGGTMIEWPATGAARIEPSSYKPTARFRVQLIVTGTITSGRFNLPSRLVRNTYGTLETNALTLTNNNASITAQACSVQTPAIAVTMPQARLADLPRIGSTTGATGFRIDLNCSGPVSISVTLIDASHPANRSSTLSAASTSTAEGVAYQILHHGRLVHYGAESAVAGNENQFLAATVAGAGITTLPFIVRYVREGRVSAGTVNANATFTMNYQ